MSSLTYLILKQRFAGKIFKEKVIDDFKNKRYKLNHIEKIISKQ